LTRPSPYAGVNTVLSDFASRSQAILAEQFLGLYLVGSLALGDFNPQTSDIDWIVITQAEISSVHFDALQALHAEFDQSGSPWANKVEAVYVPKAALNQPAATSAVYPQIERGTKLFLAPLETGWVFQRYILREQGVIVVGPQPRAWIDPIDPDEMRQAAATLSSGWLEQSRQDPDWIAWARQQNSLSFIVLTLCRLLYSLGTGQVASKPAAARWAGENTARPWNGLIQRSFAGQGSLQEVTNEEYADMLALLNHTCDLTFS
jgi:hypothetical protein